MSGRAFLVLRRWGLSARLDRRAVLAGLAMAGVASGLVLGLLLTGAYPLSLEAVGRALLGDGGEAARLVVLEWRLPRVALALLLGASLGLSGAIFQALTRNPLGSPDILGLDAGAYAGALVAGLMFGGGAVAMGLGALAGALATALLLHLLAAGQGPPGVRLIVAGIGLHAMLTACTVWMLLRASPDMALSAALWGAGSLDGRGAGHVAAAGFVLLLLALLALFLQRPLRALELSENVARAQGGLLACATGLTATATAVAGPIAFIALCAPQLARRLTGQAGIALLPAALMGAALLAGADWLGPTGWGGSRRCPCRRAWRRRGWVARIFFG